jgi:Fe(II)/alpha-ketoglutarate-dependent arginine beta-hydroxylase
MRIRHIALSNKDMVDIDHLLDSILGGEPTIEVGAFLSTAHIYSQELPRHLRIAFYEFRTEEASEALCVQGYPIEDEKIGPTPTSLRSEPGPYHACRPDILHLLFGSLLGEPIGWTSQQAGHVLNDIVPVRARENTLSGSGSARFFDFHTEDAFHPYAGDYLGLMCLRNHDRIPTILSAISDLEIGDDAKRTLFEHRFYVRVNFAQAVAQPDKKTSVLFGHPDSPYMRVNLNDQYAAPDDREARQALEVLVRELSSHKHDVTLEPGHFLYVDNFRVAHGRGAYKPRYDGTDRWLKRLTISSYLRKSRDIRASAASRVYVMGVEQQDRGPAPAAVAARAPSEKTRAYGSSAAVPLSS